MNSNLLKEIFSDQEMAKEAVEVAKELTLRARIKSEKTIKEMNEAVELAGRKAMENFEKERQENREAFWRGFCKGIFDSWWMFGIASVLLMAFNCYEVALVSTFGFLQGVIIKIIMGSDNES